MIRVAVSLVALLSKPPTSMSLQLDCNQDNHSMLKTANLLFSV